MRDPRCKFRLPRALALVAALFALAYGATAVPAFADSWTAVVASSAPSGQLTPLDLATGTPGTASAVGTSPAGVAVTPDGLYAFVAGAGAVTRVAIQGGQTTTIAIPQARPPTPDALTFIAVSPSSDLAYVSDTTIGAVWEITGLEAQSPVLDANPIFIASLTAQPEGIAFTPDGSTAYVADGEAMGAIVPIIVGDGVTEPGEAWITGVGSPYGLAISPDGTTLYATDTAGNQVFPVSLGSDDVGTPISTGAASTPTAIALTPDGDTAFVADSGAHTVTQISGLGGTPGASTLTLAGTPVDVAVAPDGCTAYVSGAGGVTPITGVAGAAPCNPSGTPTVGTPIALGSATAYAGIAITPDPAPAANFTFSVGAPGTAVSFDPSASSATVGTISSYVWSFGDGSALVSESSPADVSHTYAPGSYQASLTVTDNIGTSTNQVSTGRTVLRDGGGAAAQTQTVVAPQVIQATPATIHFATQLVGTTSAPQVVAFTNAGTATYHVSGAAVGGPFAITSDGCTGVDLTPGSSCPVAVAFAPQAAGTQLATLTLTDSAPGGSQGVVLSGDGMAPATTTTTTTTSSGATNATTTTSTTTETSVIVNNGTLGRVRVALSVKPQSRLAIARARAIAVTCAMNAPGACSVGATVAPASARALGLHVPHGAKRFVLGLGVAKFPRAGSHKIAVKVNRKVAAALTHGRKPVKITLVATAMGGDLSTGSARKSFLAR